MYWVPARLLKLEARAIAMILKIPYYAYGVDGPFQLKNYGILSARSIVAMNFSAMFRASRVTLKEWESSWKLLVSSIGQIAIEDCLSPSLSPPSWDSGPIVSRLFCAFNGFRDNYLGCIPPHLLQRIQGSFHEYGFLRPHGPPLSPDAVSPLDDPIFIELMGALWSKPGKPQKEAYNIFHRIVHPTPFPLLLHARANRWALKYFQFQISHSFISSALDTLSACMSPHFSSLVVRTFAYAWTTGTRFSHSITDCKNCKL